MSGYLLDVNVLIALSWPAHNAHRHVTRWFAAHSRYGWATCPFTQSSFARLLSNPAFAPDCLSVRDAVRLLEESVTDRHHSFWPDDLPLYEAIAPFQARLVGHKQLPDAYLLGLAVHREGKLATLDSGIGALIAQDSPHQSNLEVIAES